MIDDCIAIARAARTIITASGAIAAIKATEACACNDPCEKARQRVRDMKNKTKSGELKSCHKDDDLSILYAKSRDWLEFCNARKKRDRICTNGPQGGATEEGEEQALFSTCGAYASCMEKISEKLKKK